MRYIVRYHAAVCFYHPVSARCSTDANSIFFFSFSTPTSSPPTLPFIPSCVFSPSVPPSHCFFSRRHSSTRRSSPPSSWLPLTPLASLESHPHTVCRPYCTLSHSLSHHHLLSFPVISPVCPSACLEFFRPSFPLRCLGEAWPHYTASQGIAPVDPRVDWSLDCLVLGVFLQTFFSNPPRSAPENRSVRQEKISSPTSRCQRPAVCQMTAVIQRLPMSLPRLLL